MTGPLANLRAVDCSTGIAAAYCAKLLADAGADVIKLEPPGGDPLRRWTSGTAPVDTDEGSALFRFLHHGARSIIGSPHQFDELIAGADILIESNTMPGIDHVALAQRDPGLVILTMTPFGLTGPYAERPATEFIVQAESGGLAGRGSPHHPPIMAGGRISEWVSGTFAAVAVAAAALRAQQHGHGEHIDFSICEAMTLAGCSYADFRYQMMDCPPITAPGRTLETPSIEPTLDGWVGFCTNSRQQFDDFLVLIERPDLLADDELATFVGRQKHWDWWTVAVKEWTAKHTTTKIVERASDLRIPVAPVNAGDDVLRFPHFVERGVFVRDPTGTFTMPRRPWRLDGADPPPPAPAPRLGEHSSAIERRPHSRPAPSGPNALPLAGLKVLDLTAWWAGPVSAGVIAALGADVIHIESPRRVDGVRLTGAPTGPGDPWWERAPMFICPNANKRDLAIDLTKPEGIEVIKRLIGQADAIIENFTPRVMANFGLGWDVIQELNPRCVLVRMPAFGLSGPWANNTGFAQTMEQVTGLAWVTGHRWDQPRIQRGPSDPNAGMHAAFGLVVGLFERLRTGRGCHLEVTMVEGALNAAAELVIEYTAYANRLERDGNRAPNAAPQGLYPTGGFDEYLALSIETDAQWAAFAGAIGAPGWATDPALATHAGRRAAHDIVDEHISQWVASRDASAVAGELAAHGVPAGVAVDPRCVYLHPQTIHRGYYETVDHPVVGPRLTPTLPFRFASVERWIRTPGPTLGQHNHDIIVDELGFDEDYYQSLVERTIVGTRPVGL